MRNVQILKNGPPNIPEVDDCRWSDWTFGSSTALGYWSDTLWYINEEEKY
jgi:hypothetical protein